MGVAAALRHLPVIGKCFPASRVVRARVGAQPPSRSRLPRASRGGAPWRGRYRRHRRGRARPRPVTRSARLARGKSQAAVAARSEEHTSELQSLMRISYAVFCLKKKKIHIHNKTQQTAHTQQQLDTQNE